MLREYNAREDEQLASTTCLVTWNAVSNRKIHLQEVPYSIRRIHAPNITTLSTLALPVGLQNRIPPAPAEPDCPNLVRARRHAHGVDEAVDQGPGDTFAVFGEPRA